MNRLLLLLPVAPRYQRHAGGVPAELLWPGADGAGDGRGDDWRFIALIIEPNRIFLSGWEDDGLDALGEITQNVDNVPGQWYDVHISFDGNLMSVSRGIYGGALMPLFTSVDISMFPGYTDVSFGQGNDAEYQFDDLRFLAASISELSANRRYEYDALGRRVLQTVLEDGVPVNTWFVYDGDRVIEEYRDLEGAAHQLASRYVYGQYIDEVLQREWDQGTDGDPETVHYYLHDDLYITDSDGALVERYEYGEYGAPEVFLPGVGSLGDESSVGNRYLFNGREYDSRTNLYWYRTRYMDPEQGRFIARDTIGAWGDPNNLGNPFAYVGNNPWSGLDPFGLYGSAGGGEGDPIRWRMEHWNEYISPVEAAFLHGGLQGTAVVMDTGWQSVTLGHGERHFENAGVYSNADPGIVASKFVSVVGVEAAIAAGTGGLGNAALRGGRAAGVAHRGLLAYEITGGGIQVGGGAYKISQGDLLGGSLDP